MEFSDFDAILRLVQRSIFHSELKDGQVVSGVHVKLPVNGAMEHMVSVERRMICQSARYARMEEEASSKILAHELAYIVEHGAQFEKPVFQQNEDGIEIQIGRAVILLDRTRMSFPRFTETKTDVYLDCVKENTSES